jgi:DNA-binding MarR family transcriptional regulator/ribosomal protein S18 acetylase RimI-like enzyme
LAGLDAAVEQLRAFNRFHTRWVGALDEGLLATRHTLTEARLIFELAQSDSTSATALRERLELDAGYLSRVLARLEDAGLVRRATPAGDARRRDVSLTAAGRATFAELDRRSREQLLERLEPLDPAERRRLLNAVADVRSVLDPGRRLRAVVIRPPVAGELGWIVEAHGALYAEEYGWNTEFEALVATIVADFVRSPHAAREAAWIAEVDATAAGCVLCTRDEEHTAQVRLLLVAPRARGLGIGERLVRTCVDFARRAGYSRLVLWTNDVLVAARRIYERLGFELEGSSPHHSFGHDLVGQDWALDLRRPLRAPRADP